MGQLLDKLPLLIPIIIFLIPIVAILTAHQQKMAQIMNNRPQLPNPDVEALRQEIRELKQLIHQQAIAMDDLKLRQGVTTPQTEIDVRGRLMS
jgi:hypothetical protein